MPAENVIALHADKPRHPLDEVLSSGQKIIVDENKAEYEVKSIDTRQTSEWRIGIDD